MSAWPRRLMTVVAMTLCTACGTGDSTPSPAVPVELSGPWQATPLDLDAATTGSVESRCREAFESAEDLPVRHPQHVADAPLAIVDVRGVNIAHAIFGTDAGSGGVCWNGEVDRAGAIRSRDRAELMITWPNSGRPDGDGLCLLVAIAHPRPGDPAAYTLAGRVGPDVASLVLDVRGEGSIVPTVRDGWFLAWWPGSGEEVTITGTDAAGVRTLVASLADLQDRGEACVTA